MPFFRPLIFQMVTRKKAVKHCPRSRHRQIVSHSAANGYGGVDELGVGVGVGVGNGDVDELGVGVGVGVGNGDIDGEAGVNVGAGPGHAA